MPMPESFTAFCHQARVRLRRLIAKQAMRMVDDNGTERVVIAARSLDDKGLVAMIKTFRSLGVPVSLLPHPLDLLEAPRRCRSGSAAFR